MGKLTQALEKTRQKIAEQNTNYDDSESAGSVTTTAMFHCDAKSCEHYQEAPGTTNCVLKEITISAKGGCNQYEPVPKHSS